MKKDETFLQHLISASRHSISGFRFALSENAIRYELVLGFLNVIGVLLLPSQYLERFALIAFWIVVLLVELLNTVAETIVDMVSPDFHPLAKKAKDIGSAAVFVSLVLFFGSWVVVVVRIINRTL